MKERCDQHDLEEGERCYIENKHGIAKHKVSFNDIYDPRVIATDHAWWFPGRLHAGGEEYSKGLFGVWESNCNNMVPLDAGVPGFGANYKCVMVRIGKGKEPTCMHHCPAQCIERGDIETLAKQTEREKWVICAVKEAQRRAVRQRAECKRPQPGRFGSPDIET